MPTLAKRHFERVARILRDVGMALENNEIGPWGVIDNIERRMVNWFREENPMFDVQKFHEQCQPAQDDEQ